MDLAVQIPVPPHGPFHPWPRDLRRRRRASGLAVRRPRRQFRARGCREPGVEARRRAAPAIRRNRCSTATTSNAVQPPTRTSASPPARPISWRPTTHQEARLRKAVLSLAKETEFGKRMVNGGRLSTPSVYETPLSTADGDAWRGGARPGASMPDAPRRRPHTASRLFLTEAFIEAGIALHVAGVRQWCSRRCARRRRRKSASAAKVDWPIAKVLLARVTMPNPAPPICCGPTAMLPRVSGIRPGPRSMPRWRVRPATI